MVADKPTIIFGVIIFLSLVMLGGLIQKSYQVFSILPLGQTNQDVDCNFITNIDPQGTWDFTDYYTSEIVNGNLVQKWVALDINNDGIKEVFGQYGSAGVGAGASNYCDIFPQFQYIGFNSLGNFRMKYDSVDELLYICNIGSAMTYKKDFNTGNPVFSCSSCTPNCNNKCGGVSDGCGGTCNQQCCIPNWQCGNWTFCILGQQTRTCTDSNNCGITSGKPAITQTCGTPDCPTGQTRCSDGVCKESCSSNGTNTINILDQELFKIGSFSVTLLYILLAIGGLVILLLLLK